MHRLQAFEVRILGAPLCSDRSRKLPPRIERDDKVAFEEARRILALSGMIGFTGSFMIDMCRSMDEYQRRRFQDNDSEG